MVALVVSATGGGRFGTRAGETLTVGAVVAVELKGLALRASGATGVDAAAADSAADGAGGLEAGAAAEAASDLADADGAAAPTIRIASGRTCKATRSGSCSDCPGTGHGNTRCSARAQSAIAALSINSKTRTVRSMTFQVWNRTIRMMPQALVAGRTLASPATTRWSC